SQGKTQEVEDQRRSVKLSKNKMSVTACNDSLNAKTLNVNSVCATCDKCVLRDKHDMCVLNSVAKPIKRTVAFESNQKPRNFTRKLYERVSKTCSWWYSKFTPSGYKWKPKSRKENVNPNVSMPLDEIPEVLIDFLRLVQRGLQAQVRVVQTDKGTEFLNQTLHAYFAAEGILHQTSVARTPEQNGVVERQNRTLVEVAQTMLNAAKVPLFFWAKAIATACFTQNRSLERLRSLETSFSEYRQTNQFADAVSMILGIVHQYMDQQMKEAVREAVQMQTDRLVGNKMHKAFPLLGESSHWQYNFPLPVEGVPTARGMEIPLPRSEHNIDFHPIVDFLEASPLRIETTEEGTKILATIDGVLRTVTESSLRRNLKLQDEEGISSLPDTELFENLILMGYNISPNKRFTFKKGEGFRTPTKPHHTPSQEAQPSSHTYISSPSIPTVTSSSVPPTIEDEPASPQRDGSQGEACPTDSEFIADQDRAAMDKSSTLPHDSAPRVTSPAADEGTQEVEINRLKEKVKQLEVREGVAATNSGDDAPIKGRNIDEGEAATKRVSDDIEEMATMLISMDAAIVLASGVVDVPTGKQIDAQVARELKEQLEREDQRRAEQIARDAEIARIHAEEELQSMIDGLDSNNETVAKYLKEYCWKVKDFKGMTLEEVEAKFNSVCKQMEDFIPIGSKEEAKRIKRKSINLEQESAKKQKSSEEITEEVKSSDEVPGEKIKEMMDDLNQLWSLVKETLSKRPATSDKEMELWVELSRLYEPNVEDQLWTHS
nr:putative ribonuclease H-like domain-containing protein [Tanacetum cinerariifolium]